ncbi:ester cyclase [Rhodococcus sp. NPDC057014]|uniref:ester cyclase n=1 Tax=Rhodococcus sp. NPDC057014 TaxID=3346000 RepID=UPI0036399919
MNRPSGPLLREIELINSADVTTETGLDDLVGQIVELFAEDVQMVDLSTSKTVKGHEEMRAYCREYFGPLSNMVIDVDKIFDAENATTMVLTISGDHTGELLGVAPTGRRVSYPAICVMELNEDNSKMRHETLGYDTGFILSQIT